MRTAQLLLASGYNRNLTPGWVWSVLGLGAAMIPFLSSRLSWGAWNFWKINYGLPLVIFTILAYFFSALICSRLRLLPRAEGIGVVILVVTASFMTIVAFLALGRIYYSRSFLLFSWSFSVTWLCLSYYFYTTTSQLVLAVIPGGMNSELGSLRGIVWKILKNPEGPGLCNGVVVDLHQKLSSKWMRFLSNCSIKRIPVYHSAVVFEVATGRVSLSHLSEGLFEEFEQAPIYAYLKRTIDIAIVLFLSPLMVVLGLFVSFLVWAESGGGVIFWQERVGQNGRPFRLYKFRSMENNETDKSAKFAQIRDSRITRVGRFIRRFRFDEIPQFWNVLRGDMSLIGPRPEQIAFAEKFQKDISFYGYRHLVKPGITGWAQVNQGYVADINEVEKKLEYDLYYLKYLSIPLDCLIVFKTIRTIATGFGAR